MATRMKSRNLLLFAALLTGVAGAALQAFDMHRMESFNQAVSTGKLPDHDKLRFEAKYAAAYWLAKSGRYQDATQLFVQLMEAGGNAEQMAAVQYNLGNIFFLRGLLVNRSGGIVHAEAEYLLTQAKMAYQQSLRLDNAHLDVRHNLDRVLSLLPEDSVPKNEQDKLGIVMGNIPVGLP
ncbi:MAG TPA: hypothetical protein VGK14_09565 [Novimethylophilus sp.]|jgi:tetratricopeptide (TPR) repeat protein|uniref:hypothetical protein n=1 Tax=Novimethylophilus sp. TaxID=2137426 RepID=UPI002F3EEBE8